MEFLYFIILGAVQGITEFLPVSSSGHLVLVNKLFNYNGNFVFLSILLHLATLFAVVIVLRKEVLYLIKNPFCKTSKMLIIATIPAIIVALLFKDFVESAFGGTFLPICFIATAVVLFATQMFSRQNANKQFSYKSAVVMGLAQAIAILPGISRSGSTICAGLMCGEKREEVSRFSFLMSIPIILCSLAYEVFSCLKNGVPLFAGSAINLIAGFITAFITGIFAVKFMLKIVQKGKYSYFAVYLIIIGIIAFFI